MPTPRVVLATIGSLGDLHPFIAIGRALEAQGAQVTLAIPEDGVAKVTAAGLHAVAILPGYDSICRRLGLGAEEVAAKVIADTGFVFDAILIPSLAESARALDAAAEGADVLVGSIFAFAAGIVAEKRRIPFVPVVLQPMTLFSRFAPPRAPGFGIMRHRPRTALGRGWNGVFYSLARSRLRRRYGATVDAVRGEHGLKPNAGAILFDQSVAPAATLCCWSEALGGLPPDAPASVILTGFPFFDSHTGAEESMPSALEDFLACGDPPLVFTLGSVAVEAAGKFYEQATAAARALGRRAVMLTGKPGDPRVEGGCLFMDYAPHSALFPRAAAVIHHGGVGTSGQALRAGRPQIVVPHFGDQFDNAARLRQAGCASIMPKERFEADAVATAIDALLDDRIVGEAARTAAAIVAGENGAGAAARRILSRVLTD